MFKNYLLAAIRNFLRHKGYFFLNLAGLSLGIAFSLIIFLHLQTELSFDQHFPDHQRVYRITQMAGNGYHWSVISPPLGPEFKNFVPGIETYARLNDRGSTVFNRTQENGLRKAYKAERGFFADSTIFDVFNIKSIDGDLKSALTQPGNIVFTESLAKKIFGNEKAVGQSVIAGKETEFIVAAVIPDQPFNSHLQFDYLRPMVAFYNYFYDNDLSNWIESRGWMSMYTYIKLQPEVSLADVEAQLPGFSDFYFQDDGTTENSSKLILQSMLDIHLTPNMVQDLTQQRDRKNIYIFGGIALIILIIAGVNFINISLALSLNRIREVGIRKAIGAEKQQIMTQFLIEGLLLIILAASISILILQATLPLYSQISGYELSLSEILTPLHIGMLIGTMAVIFLISGIYPAIFVSDFKPINIIRGVRDPRSSISLIRRYLVILQSVISVFMIFSTIIIYLQVNYFNNKDIGIDKESVLVYRLFGDLRRSFYGDFSTYRDELTSDPSIVSISTCTAMPGDHFSVEGFKTAEIPESTQLPPVRVVHANEGYFETLGLDIIEGKNFAEAGLEGDMFIINQAAVENLNLGQAVGKIGQNMTFGAEGEIIGIVQSFNFESLHKTVEPLVVQYGKDPFGYMLIRINTDDVKSTIARINQKLDNIKPDQVYSYYFLDEQMQSLYSNEWRVGEIFKIFGLLAIFISCLGLFGMSSLSAAKRKKEMGIRKVLGASTSSLMSLMSKNYIKVVLIANFIALPLAWWGMSRWLDNFAFHISINPLVLLISFIFSLLITFVSVGSQIFKTARTNPIETIRYE